MGKLVDMNESLLQYWRLQLVNWKECIYRIIAAILYTPMGQLVDKSLHDHSCNTVDSNG